MLTANVPHNWKGPAPASIQWLFPPVVTIVDRHHAAPDQILQRAAHSIFVKGGVARHRLGLASALPWQRREHFSLDQIRRFVSVRHFIVIILGASSPPRRWPCRESAVLTGKDG